MIIPKSGFLRCYHWQMKLVSQNWLISCFQNQNDDSMHLKDNSVITTHRMTKSASWFNSLSRRASRKTPTKKRTYALGSSNLENLAPGATRPRLNKWVEKYFSHQYNLLLFLHLCIVASSELVMLCQRVCQRYSSRSARWEHKHLIRGSLLSAIFS